MRQHDSGSPAASQQSVTVALGRFDDLLTKGLGELIRSDPSLTIIAEHIEPSRISVVLGAHRPDVAVLDVGALEKLAQVRELSVEHRSTRLVLLVAGLSSVECAQLLAFGASACLARDTQGRDVLSAIHLASRGLQVTPRSLPAGRAPLGGELLTRREAEVLPLLERGQTNPQIAATLQIGVETVRTHARHIYRKLGVSSRGEISALP
jgi:DNA-binding NarL/FixJ family response regulator